MVVDTSERTPLINGLDDERIAEAQEALKNKDSPENLSRSRIVAIFAANWLGVFLGALDTTIVATLVSPISASFESSNQVSWLGSSYLLTLASTTPLYGKLSDIIGRRPAMLIAMFLFTLGTLLCGLSNSMTMLIAARTLAGMGGGGIMTLSSIVASDIIPTRKRGFIQGIVNLFYGAGSALGAPLGGLIVSRLDWRVAFLMQVPFLVLAWILVFLFVRYTLPGTTTSKRAAFKEIDWLGCITLITCISAFLLALSFKNNFGLAWSHPKVWASLIVFAVFLVLFILVEAYVAINPVMPLRILSHRSTICIALSNFLFSALNFSILYNYPTFYETVQLQEPKGAGLHVVPMSVALSIGSLGAGWIMRRTGKYYYLNLIAAALPMVSAAMMCFMNTTPRWTDWVNPLPGSIGTGANVTILLIALLANVDRDDMAVATGISYLFRYTGQVFGVGLSGGVLQGALTTELKKRITGLNATKLIERIRTVSTSIPKLEPALRAQAIESYRIALRWVFVLIGGLALLNFTLSIFIEEHPLPGSFEEEQKIRDQRRGHSGTATPRYGS